MWIIITWFGIILICLLVNFPGADCLSSGSLCSVTAGNHSLASLVMLVCLLASQRNCIDTNCPYIYQFVIGITYYRHITLFLLMDLLSSFMCVCRISTLYILMGSKLSWLPVYIWYLHTSVLFLTLLLLLIWLWKLKTWCYHVKLWCCYLFVFIIWHVMNCSASFVIL